MAFLSIISFTQLQASDTDGPYLELWAKPSKPNLNIRRHASPTLREKLCNPPQDENPKEKTIKEKTFEKVVLRGYKKVNLWSLDFKKTKQLEIIGDKGKTKVSKSKLLPIDHFSSLKEITFDNAYGPGYDMLSISLVNRPYTPYESVDVFTLKNTDAPSKKCNAVPRKVKELQFHNVKGLLEFFQSPKFKHLNQLKKITLSGFSDESEKVEITSLLIEHAVSCTSLPKRLKEVIVNN